MKNRQAPRRVSLDPEDAVEKLRGKIRELSKQLEQEKRYSKSLEKKLKKSPAETKKTKEPPKPAGQVCTNCGKNEIEEKDFFSPSGVITWIVCSLCHHKERKR